MYAGIALAAVLALVRHDPQEQQQPTLAPQQYVLRVWTGTVATPSWWSDKKRKAYRFTRYEVVLAESYAETPSIETTDPWGQAETVTAEARVVREVLIEELMERAREDAMKTVDPTPCFPGEFCD